MPDDEHNERLPYNDPSIRERWMAADDAAVEVPVEMIEIETPADPEATPTTRVIHSFPAAPTDPPVAEKVDVHAMPLKQGFRALDMFLVTGVFLVVGIAPMILAPVAMSGAGIIPNSLLLFFLWKFVKSREDGMLVVGLAGRTTIDSWRNAVAISVVGYFALSFANMVNAHIWTWLFRTFMHRQIVLPEFEEMRLLTLLNINVDVYRIQSHELLSLVFIVLSVAVVTPMFEELWFRGVGMAGYLTTGSPMRAIIWTSLVFGALHGPFRFIYATTAGLIFGITREKSNTIFPCMVQHAAINLIAVFFFSMQHGTVA